MPIYEYRCTQCHHTFECFQTVGEPAPACPQCGSQSKKVYASVGLIFKGSGFYTTDHRKAPAPGNGEKPPAGTGEKSSSGTETPAAPAAPAKGSDTPAKP